MKRGTPSICHRPSAIQCSSGRNLAALWGLALLLCLAAAFLSGCATSRLETPAKTFHFPENTFAFANELTWLYSFDDEGRWTARARQPKPDYRLRCFVVARASLQFFRFARFDPRQPEADEAHYRALVRRVVSTNPRRRLPECERITIPGYANLKDFSAAREELLKEECGSAWESYFQRGNWRMVLPFSRGQQERMAAQLLASVRRDGAAVVHLARFPSLAINHAILLFDAEESPQKIQFSAYDPNYPEQAVSLTFDRPSRTFSLPANDYYPGGPVNAYQVYHRWNY